MVKLHSRIYHRLYIQVPVLGDLGKHDSVKVMGRIEIQHVDDVLVLVNKIHVSSFQGGGPMAKDHVIKMMVAAGCPLEEDGMNFIVGVDAARSIFKMLSKTFSTLTGNYDHDAFDDDLEGVVLDVMRGHATMIHQVMLFRSVLGSVGDRAAIGRRWYNFAEHRSASILREILDQGEVSLADVKMELLELLDIKRICFEP